VITKNKSCIDCLYCKVSVNTTTHSRLCYCDKVSIKERYAERYWVGKGPCIQFEDMVYEKKGPPPETKFLPAVKEV
jgi:hypothetical protein